ncbi:MAG: hypothetical protein AB1556_17555 [Bacillota bacterium]
MAQPYFKTIEQGAEPEPRFVVRHKKILLPAGAVLVIAIMIGVVYFFSTGMTAGKMQRTAGTATGKGAGAPAGPAYTVLPETKRPLAEGAEKSTPSADAGQTVDPFAGPMVLRGVITGGGGSLAIVEVGGAACIVRESEIVADVWTVKEIKDRQVVLAAGDEELYLGFNGKVLRKVKPAGKNGGKGGE